MIKLRDRFRKVEEAIGRSKYAPIPKEAVNDGFLSQEEVTRYNALVEKANGFLHGLKSQQKKLTDKDTRYLLDGLFWAMGAGAGLIVLGSFGGRGGGDNEGNVILGGLYSGILTAMATDAVQKLRNRRRQKSLVNYFERNVDDFNRTSTEIEQISGQMSQSLKTRGFVALEDLAKTADLALCGSKVGQEQDAKKLEISVNEFDAKIDTLKKLVSEYRGSMQVINGNKDLAVNKIDRGYSETKPGIGRTVKSIGVGIVKAAMAYALSLWTFNAISDIKAGNSQPIVRKDWGQKDWEYLQSINDSIGQVKARYGLNNVEIRADFPDYCRNGGEKPGAYYVPGEYVIVSENFKRDFVRRELYKIREFELKPKKDQKITKVPTKTVLGVDLARVHSLKD
jgi:hypothetical protein